LHQEISSCIQSQIDEETMRSIIPTYQTIATA
jgi:hypothetical protein